MSMDHPAQMLGLKPLDVASLTPDTLRSIASFTNVRIDIHLQSSTDQTLVVFVSGDSRADVSLATRLIYMNIMTRDPTHAAMA